MTRLETPLSPHSQEAEDQFPCLPDPETDLGHLVQKLLDGTPSPSPEDIDKAIFEAERILFDEKMNVNAELDEVKKGLVEIVNTLHKIRRDQSFVKIMNNTKNERRQEIIEKDFENDEKRAMRAAEDIEKTGGVLDTLNKQSRNNFQRIFFGGKTLEEVEKACEEQGNDKGSWYWRPIVQQLYKEFQEFEEKHKGKKISDEGYEDWAIRLMQECERLRREGFYLEDE